jgi:hypothetical protein
MSLQSICKIPQSDDKTLSCFVDGS